MKTEKYFAFLIAIIYITIQCVIFADDSIGDKQSFSQQIRNLQDETGYLCSFIEATSLVTTKELIKLMQDAHRHCPNLQEIEVSLANIAMQADTYHSYVIQQLSDCNAILYMLTKSLDNGGLVDYYLKEGNYSLVTSTIDKWHQSFLNFKSEFHLKDIPLDIILNNKKSFFYDNWIGGIVEIISTLIMLLITSVVLLKVFTWMGLIIWITTLFSSSTTDSCQEEVPIKNDTPQVQVTQINSNNRNLRQRQPKPNQQAHPPEDNVKPLAPNDSNLEERNIASSSAKSSSNKFPTIKTIVWLITLCGLIVITASWDPSKISLSKSSRYDWYPDATAALEKMRVDRDEVQSTTSRQIRSIEELQRHANIYHDKSIQANADLLISNLATAIQQASKEISDLYIAGEQLPSVFRKTYTNIEAKAKKSGRLTEANALLVALKNTSETYEKLQRSIQSLMSNQQILLPTLKEQTQSMQALVQQGNVLDIHRIAKQHISTSMKIDGYLYNVEIVVKQLIKIAENDDIDGMKRAINELKDQTVLDQYKAMLFGAAGGVGGGLGGAVLGTVAIKSGYAIVSVTATAVAGPVAAAIGGVGLFGVAAFAFATNFDKYKDAARYKFDLDILEVQRGNLHTAMKNLEKAINDQQTASKATQTALNNIVTHSLSFSNISGFTLPTPKRTALSNELLHIIQQYNIMISGFNSFKQHMADKDQKRLPG